jgi:hypothetical protein
MFGVLKVTGPPWCQLELVRSSDGRRHLHLTMIGMGTVTLIRAQVVFIIIVLCCSCISLIHTRLMDSIERRVQLWRGFSCQSGRVDPQCNICALSGFLFAKDDVLGLPN